MELKTGMVFRHAFDGRKWHCGGCNAPFVNDGSAIKRAGRHALDGKEYCPDCYEHRVAGQRAKPELT